MATTSSGTMWPKFQLTKSLKFTKAGSLAAKKAAKYLLHPSTDRVVSSGPKGPILRQGYVTANFSADPFEFEKRRDGSSPDAHVYPLTCKPETTFQKGELVCAIIMPHRVYSPSGMISNVRITSSVNGLTAEELEACHFVGQLTTASNSSDTETLQQNVGAEPFVAVDDQAAVIVAGTGTIDNTSVDLIPAAYMVVLDFPEYAEENGIRVPVFSSPTQAVDTKFRFATRPFRHMTPAVVFINLARKVVKFAKKFREHSAHIEPKTLYDHVSKQTEEFVKHGTVCLSQFSIPRCPLRRWWYYLLYMISGHRRKDHFDAMYYGVSDEMIKDFSRNMEGARVSGSITLFPSRPSKHPHDVQEDETVHIPKMPEISDKNQRPDWDKFTDGTYAHIHMLTLPIQIFTEYEDVFRRLVVGVALEDIPPGGEGACLFGSRNM